MVNYVRDEKRHTQVRRKAETNEANRSLEGGGKGQRMVRKGTWERDKASLGDTHVEGRKKGSEVGLLGWIWQGGKLSPCVVHMGARR